ncbi:hypothetical protein BDP27DRAFT_10164 [Rhodocollybia butyracea]|uniref:Uncharacterized protein n=1 Tax=Rhodocollybia butyracea TaxID=206335 RepID=A0A9P5UGI5_9AGAR|nr:hypothetical protein BDP27DRAFT_10164 [Rhodocollybia butyracea]
MAGRLRDVLLSILSVSQLPEVSSLKRTHPSPESGVFTDNGSSWDLTENELTDAGANRPIAGSMRAANWTEKNSQWDLPLNPIVGGLPHIDIGTGFAPDYSATNMPGQPTSWTTGDDYEFSLGQFTTKDSSQFEDDWSHFMTNVDELLDTLTAGQL